ncbi:hypothetical protein DDD_1303 [Nonlabens dokdonensis DSW-6]|uniref:Uncharacterized protein n=1 Tax=Nonlabens dokdonensis (strain DSM 17205 / KCTC 12402 / DSW-6) TaxID=592029 RepID=L7W4B0_NONDD|nr:hypothetical protein DDD_1303 [Nonlabens dokdonensis DSW-6]
MAKYSTNLFMINQLFMVIPLSRKRNYQKSRKLNYFKRILER